MKDLTDRLAESKAKHDAIAEGASIPALTTDGPRNDRERELERQLAETKETLRVTVLAHDGLDAENAKLREALTALVDACLNFGDVASEIATAQTVLGEQASEENEPPKEEVSE